MLALAWLVYRPGLSGGFLFDDFVNLDALGATGPVDNWRTFWRYITSGTADPTGRPLALLSFLIDARDWPADASVFLRHNVLLHLINGALLFVLLRQLDQRLRANRVRNDFTALLAASLWLLHPLLVSTTLYAVQREAMLPATFTLLGLLAYAHGREHFDRSNGASGTAWMVVGIGLGTLLAMACKANGILLPLLAWTLEATVWRVCEHGIGPDASRRLRILKWALLILPSLAVLAYLAPYLLRVDADLTHRSWTIGQRLLTEPRVLVEYLQLLIVPRSISTGIYNDGYAASLGWLSPISTIPALFVVTGLLVLAARSRVRLPRLSAALLFFFAGHLLESTVIPLELYFEHRNYLPAMLLFWPLAHVLASWKVGKGLRIGLAIGLLALFGVTTFQRASLWGQPDKMAVLWASQNPGSARAQATAAMASMRAGQVRSAAERLAPLWQDNPTELQLGFNYIDAACQLGGITAEEKSALTQALASAANGQLMIHRWLARAIDAAASGRCTGMDLQDVEQWIQASAGNPGISPPAVRDQTIEPLLGRLAIASKHPELALKHFNAALAAFVTPDNAAKHVALLARAGYFVEARDHLDYYESLRGQTRKPSKGMRRVHAKVLEWQGYWPNEMAVLRQKLDAEILAQRSVTP